MRAFQLILGIGGLSLIAWVDWTLAIGLFLVLWSENLRWHG